MSHEPPMPANALSAEDAKLVTLARGASVRVKAATGAAVRDDTGRTYVGADVALPGLALSSVQLAVAQAFAAGAQGLEAVAVVGLQPHLHHRDKELLTAVGRGDLNVFLVDAPTATVTQQVRL